MEYKLYFYAVLIIAYTYGVWHVSSQYTSSGYNKEKAAMISKAAAELKVAQDQADTFGRKLAEEQASQFDQQLLITKDVIRETTKPIYHQCSVTDDGLRIIERAIDNANGTRK